MKCVITMPNIQHVATSGIDNIKKHIGCPLKTPTNAKTSELDASQRAGHEILQTNKQSQNQKNDDRNAPLKNKSKTPKTNGNITQDRQPA